MPPLPLLLSIDLLLRGGAIVLLLLIAVLLLRDHRTVTAARLGAAFATGAAFYVICSAGGFHDRFPLTGTFVLAIAAANNLVFWLFARALFDDAFRLRPWHAGLWLAIAATALFTGLYLEPRHASETGVAWGLLSIQSVVFALLAAAQVLATWRNDLVEPRRRLRVFIVTAAAIHTVATTAAGMVTGGRPGPVAEVWQIGFLLAIASIVAWSLLQASGDVGLFAPDGEPAVAPVPAALGPAAGLAPEDRTLAANLERLMTVERFYREEGLSIGRLAQKIGVPEYRLRRAINQGLGHRNFASYLNRYRLGDARSALGDPAQVEVPVLTIALDAGFSSLGPFNRAFKAETGLTPSEFRRQTLSGAIDSGVGFAGNTMRQGAFPESAGRISKPA